MSKQRTITMTGYYRVSTKAESQKTSFKAQPALFRTLLSLPEYKHYRPASRFYFDYGTSGTKLNRPGFKQMLEDAGLDVEIEDKKKIPHPEYPDKLMNQRIYKVSVNPSKKPLFEEIWIKNTSRFARNINGYQILQTLRLAGVFVFFIDMRLTTRNEEDMPAIRKRLDEDMAYSEQNSRNRKITQIQYEQENRLSGHPYGYVYHKKTKSSNPYYTIHPTESEVVKKIFDYCIEGLGTVAIGKRLAAEGHLNRSGKPFSDSSIKKILDNEKYMGLNTCGKFTTGTLFEKLDSAKVRDDYKSRLSKSEGLPAIITPEIWEAAHTAIRSRQTNPKDPHSRGTTIPRHPYKDLLTCSLCGNHFVYDNNGGRGFFKCATKAKDGIKACNCNNLFVYKLDEFIKNLQNGGIYSLIQTDYEMTIISLITLIELYLDKYKNPHDISQSTEEYKLLQEELESSQKVRDNLLDMLLSSSYSESSFKTFKERVDEIEEKIKSIETQMEELLTSPAEVAKTLENIFAITFQEFTLFEQRKKKYTSDEVLQMLSKIKIYGMTANNSGGRPPATILVPILKSTEQAQGLINLGFETFGYRYRNTLPNYESPEDFISKRVGHQSIEDVNPVDRDDLPACEREKYYTPAPKGKRQWPTTSSKYLFLNEAYYTHDGEIGYIQDLGVKENSTLQQLKSYTNKLYMEFLKTQKLHTFA